MVVFLLWRISGNSDFVFIACNKDYNRTSGIRFPVLLFLMFLFELALAQGASVSRGNQTLIVGKPTRSCRPAGLRQAWWSACAWAWASPCSSARYRAFCSQHVAFFKWAWRGGFCVSSQEDKGRWSRMSGGHVFGFGADGANQVRKTQRPTENGLRISSCTSARVAAKQNVCARVCLHVSVYARICVYVLCCMNIIEG